MTEVKGDEVLLKRTPYEIYNMFSDLRNFAAAIPPDKVGDVQADHDSMTFKVQGFELGLEIAEKAPYSLISFKERGSSPFPFKFTIHLYPVGLDATLFYVELSAQLNTFMKMVIGDKLQEMVDKMTEQLEQAINSGITPTFEPESFI